MKIHASQRDCTDADRAVLMIESWAFSRARLCGWRALSGILDDSWQPSATGISNKQVAIWHESRYFPRQCLNTGIIWLHSGQKAYGMD